ncbi:MAG: hypothetical protein ACLUEK_07915 [Oscillospiraceae bacterium]
METGIPVSMLNTAEDAYANPHWQARNDFIKIIDANRRRPVDIATMPCFGARPATSTRAPRCSARSPTPS